MAHLIEAGSERLPTIHVILRGSEREPESRGRTLTDQIAKLAHQ